MIEISLNDLIEVYSLAAIGKVLEGLVHNMNGPLQNLGMDLEMMALSAEQSGQQGDTGKTFATRLERMNEEFENIIQLVKTTSLKASLSQEFGKQTRMNHHLQRELSFLNANLYFKHNVQMNIELEDPSPLLSDLPENIPHSVSWFLQGLVEEVEREEIPGFNLKAVTSPPNYQISMITEGKTLSGRFQSLLKRYDSTAGILQMEAEDMGMRLALHCFKNAGVTLTFQGEAGRSQINLDIPIAGEASTDG